MRSRSWIGYERTLTLENETLTLDRVLGKEKDEEGNLPGPPDTAVARKSYHRRHGWRADRGPARPWLRENSAVPNPYPNPLGD